MRFGTAELDPGSGLRQQVCPLWGDGDLRVLDWIESTCCPHPSLRSGLNVSQTPSARVDRIPTRAGPGLRVQTRSEGPDPV
ncbi:hypothetical protein EYF80_033351 [Liparis tanakae]|uniref:Uncharacterized protein n=1 Tax=Liparis tanakae TaxID=230148 RepID=A0A4Z2GSV0_9TELE|nr:hypothetical protein EYF80_033351 [Liparis tanakae]